ncbi:MAG: choice-of-anchor J domain-containing protein [Chitinophagaceae bacterium]|nr:choice-of-anchor J domain-containing protein [Chitinophagaceae bacterium]
MKPFYLFLMAVLLISGTSNCVRHLDEPPEYSGPRIKATISITEIKRLHIPNNFEKIQDDLIIEGIVTANDKTDNFYKSIMIQDSTAGITIRLDGFSLFNIYPIGRKIFIRLKGLWLGDYGGMIQLGAGVNKSNPQFPELIPIPQPLFDRVIVKGDLDQKILPRKLKMGELNDSLQSMLVTLTDVEFDHTDTAKPYADAVNKQTIAHTLRTCGIGSVYVRTSGFAKFASALTARGHGDITGIFSMFRTQKQILLRDTSDVQMNGLRCTVTGPKQIYAEDFSGQLADSVISIPQIKNVSEIGGRFFLGKIVSGNPCAEISAFATREQTVITWLILPVINLDHSSNEILRFSTKDGFDNGAVLQVLVSTNYDGGDAPWKARWTQLPAIIAKGSITGYSKEWVNSGDVSLHHLKGKVYIAFRYEGNDPPAQAAKLTTTFRIDNIQVVGN